MGDSNDAMTHTITEPRHDMEFDSHETAYSFYKEYARSVGFGTAKLSSRRSRASKEFIDAKFSCIRYGNKQQSDDAVNPRPSPKIGCKASMHVKKGKNGKWFVYSFMKEHNHELLPAQAHFFRSHRDADSLKGDRMRKRKNLSSGSKILNAYQSFDCLDTYLRIPHDKGRSLVLEAGDAQMLLELFMHIQEDNPKFFYAVDLNEEHRLRNVFWVDAKGIEDYSKFGDVVSFDTTYYTNKYKIPLVLFIGVNHHIQPTLFGCALIADDTVYTLVWLMQTWFAAMGERAPQVILSDQNHAMKVAVADVFPETRHCFSIWHILDKIPRQLEYLNLSQDTFMAKLKKCIFRSSTESEFEKRWWKLVDRFNLGDVERVQLLYNDRMQWVPTFIRDISFAGLSTVSRAESLNTWFDKYVTLETSVREFIDKYRVVLEDRYEEEAKADFDSWHETPELKSPSPFEKQMSLVYTHEIFKKFQVEVLGAAACHLNIENEDARTIVYSVKDFEDDLSYLVEWNESKSSIYCSCHLFEFKGYLCRHTIIVLQMSGFFSIPPRYVLQRWTNTCRHSVGEKLDEVQLKVRRYNDLCRRAIILGEEGSLSHESYEVALRAINEVLKECLSARNLVENEQQQRIPSSNFSVSELEEGGQSCERTKGQTSDAGPSSRSKVPWRTNLGKAKFANENYAAKTGKLPKSDCLRIGAHNDLHSEELNRATSANAHTLPTLYHHVMPPPFQGMTAPQLQQSHLPQ